MPSSRTSVLLVALVLLLAGSALAQNPAPGPPRSLQVTDVPGDAGTALRVSFANSLDDGAGANDVNRYRIYRRLASDPNPPTCIAVITATDAATYGYTITGLTVNTSYNIGVAAFDGVAESTRVAVNATPLDNLPPAPPRNVALADVPGDTGTALLLTFDASLADIGGPRDVQRYRVFRKVTSASTDPVCIVVITATHAANYAYTITGLTRGTSYTIGVEAFDGEFASTRPTVNGTPLDNVAPGPPRNVAVGDLPGDAGTALRLTFTASVDDGGGANDVTRYRVYKKLASAAGAPVLLDAIVATKSATYSYTFTGLTRNTAYTIGVEAVDATFTSTRVLVNGTPLDNIAPRPPRNVQLADVPYDGGTALVLTFAASEDDGAGANDVTRYRISQKLTSAAGAPVVFDAVLATKAPAYSYIVRGLTRDASYTIGIQAYDGALNSTRVDVTGTPLDNKAPGAPKNLRLTDVPNDTGTALTLTFDRSYDDGAREDDLVEYRVYLEGPGVATAATLIHTIPATGATSYSYNITGLTVNTTYTVSVESWDGKLPATRVSVSGTPRDNKPPGPPTTVRAADVPSDDGGALNISWNASAADGSGVNDVTRYRIYRRLASATTTPPTLIDGVPATKAASYTYRATGLTNGVAYVFGVTAYDGTYESARVDAAAATPADNTVPRSPTGLVVEDWPEDDGTSLKASFAASPDDVATDREVTRYELWKAAGLTAAGTKVTDITATAAARYEARVTGLTPGVPVFLWVVAIGTTGTSTPTGRVSGTPLDNRPVLPPSALTAADHPYDTGRVIDLTWARSGDDGIGRNHVTKYNVYRKMANVTQELTLVGTVTATDATAYAWSDTSVPLDLILYEYTVKAGTATGVESSAVGPARAASENNNVVVFQPPTGFAVVDVAADSGGQLLLTWTRSTSEGDIGPPPPPPVLSGVSTSAAGTVQPLGGYGGSYEFYRRTATTTYTAAPTFTVSAAGTNNPMTYVNSGLLDGTRYYYKMRYRRYNQISELTAEVSAIPVNNRASASAAAVDTADAGLSVDLAEAPQSFAVGQDLTLNVEVTGQGASTVYLQYSVNGAAAARTAAVTGQDSFTAQIKLKTGALSPGSIIQVRAVVVSGSETAVSGVTTIAAASL